MNSEITFTDTLTTRTRQLRAAAKLGWAIESNWTDPFVFITYQIVRPIFGALILVVMYQIIRGRHADPQTFAMIYVGSAFFVIVLNSVNVIARIIFEDRERYEMIRYVYMAPIGLGPYLLARGVTNIAATLASVVITVALGVIGFGVNVDLALANVPTFVAAMGLGIIATLALGLILAGLSLILANHGFEFPEGVTGALFLVSGVVFSIDILPGALAALSRWLPWTYWLEAMRRTLLGASFHASLAGLTDGVLMARLAILTVVTSLAAWMILSGALRIAIAKGKLDEKTDH